MSSFFRYLILSVFVFLTACGVPLTEKQKVENTAVVFSKQFIKDLQDQNNSALYATLHPELQENEKFNELLKIRNYLHSQNQISTIDLVDYRYITISSSVSGNSQTVTSVALQYQYANDKPVLVQLRLTDGKLPYQLEWVNVTQLDRSLQETNSFSFAGKSFLHYLFIIAMLVAFAVSIYAFIQCLRMPKFKRKWLWALFTLLGFGAVGLNWTTGEMGFNILNIQMLSAAFVRQGFLGQWILSVSFPLGAVMFLHKRKTMLSEQNEPEEANV